MVSGVHRINRRLEPRKIQSNHSTDHNAGMTLYTDAVTIPSNSVIASLLQTESSEKEPPNNGADTPGPDDSSKDYTNGHSTEKKLGRKWEVELNAS